MQICEPKCRWGNPKGTQRSKYSVRVSIFVMIIVIDLIIIIDQVNLPKSLRVSQNYLDVKVTFTEVIAKLMERSWPLQLVHL